MRTGILHNGTGESNYEIRNIIFLAEKLEKLGVEINLENIGDPIAKGEKIPGWMKDIVANIAQDDVSYSYCPSQGILKTRQYLAERNNRRGGAAISPEDIIFFNGLGEAIGKIYGFLTKNSRVIIPSPTYTAHSASEAAHAEQPNVYYSLDPKNQWCPDTAELRRTVRNDPEIVAVLLINPDNPTGVVYPEKTLKEIVDIAREFDLFIIADEVYENLVFRNSGTKGLCEVIGDVPGIAMKGISKEVPWPGSRCGWIEIYNRMKDPVFNGYIRSIFNAKMMEVCSTTLPQKAIPLILEHPEYTDYVNERKIRYERLSKIAEDILRSIPGVIINRPKGSFYMTLVFEKGVLSRNRKISIRDKRINNLIEGLIIDKKINPDKVFVYYLLASTGICVVPLSSFNTDLQGFRFTLLNPDESAFAQMVEKIAGSINAYLNSDTVIS